MGVAKVPEKHAKIIEIFQTNLSYAKTAGILCVSKQYVHWIIRKYGRAPDKPKRISREEYRENRLKERISTFLSKMRITKIDSCWEWQGYKYPLGYGLACLFGEKYAHRVSWIIFNGPIPSGMNVLHTCDNRCCANPNHLYLGTQKENCRDREERYYSNHARPQSRKKKCLHN